MHRLLLAVVVFALACAPGVGGGAGNVSPAADAGADAGPTLDGGSASADAGIATDPSWTLVDVGGPEACSTGAGCPIPALHVGRDGVLESGVHRFNLGPCLKCSADRIVRRWNGEAWDTLLSENAWPGTYSSTAFADDPARSDRRFFADGALSDPYHPPLPIHIWTIDAAGVREELPPVGSSGVAYDPAIAVDGAGVLSVAWLEYAYPSVIVRAARASGGVWTPLPDVTAGSYSAGLFVDLALDGQGTPIVATCDDASVRVSRLAPDASRWDPLPALDWPAAPGRGCAVRALSDGDGVVFAFGPLSGFVSVVRWDGVRWTTLGADVGTNVFALAHSPRGTLVVATTGGVLELTDGWRLIAPSTLDFEPVALESDATGIWTWWTRPWTTEHTPSAQLRRLTVQ